MELDEVIASWEKEEQSVRARLMAPGVAAQEQVRGMSGMEMFQAIFAGELPPPPIGETLDFVPIHMAPGIAVFQGPPATEALQPARHRARRLVRHAARFGRGLRRAHDAAGRQGLYDAGAEGEHGAGADQGGALRARRGQGDPCGEAGGDCRGADRRAGWQAVCACDDDLFGFWLRRPD